ncbi:MurR/RpiR family transcriptional regulator [Cytobacillus purgationiresistens]|uniref:DNA-binding MurR/RpiR family transcriptional regulator n=1 Tax=Cytobacillus purgationiresistens TaxID=863449 RepID=A0ABU0AAH5_9BACI|nr:MurR/RpiR family transcriptional regulator [Cytobacillus purgationiresistens]MDQ0268254.1 DNA-binding MurR/RpiR family transcriptional regulator [Cytobacillus purgationiresistens]
MQNIYQRMAEKMPQMSKSQEKVASYILKNMNTVPFLTVAKLAKKAEVSEATIVRFAVFLGYSGYSELQQLMQSSVQKQLTTPERLKMSSDVYNDQVQGIYEVFQDDISNIKATMEKLDEQQFLKAANLLLKGRRIYICANRSAKAIGVFLQYYLNIILGHSEMIGSADIVSEQLYKLQEDDVVIGISFARYSMNTIELVKYAKEQGATTIAITDNLMSPLIPHSDVVLTASSQLPTFIDSFTAPFSLINALIAYLGKERMNVVEDRLGKLEELWERFDIFYKKQGGGK